LNDKCMSTVTACTSDAACGPAVAELATCACGKAKTPEQCQMTFAQDGGDPALALAECYTLNCQTACE
jgi:hypothetical protein